MIKRGIFVILFLLINLCLIAQKNVTGVVTDAEKQPVTGVSVIVKGTAVGMVTDVNGKFSITVPAGSNALLFSFIGYVTQEIPVGDKTVIDVVLAEDLQTLDEVVVVGYGVQKKSDLTSASVSVSSEKLKSSIAPNLDQALQGRAAGVTAVYTSGQPGSSVSISIRGQGTLGNATPLYVIDGIPVQNVGQSGFQVGLGGALGNGSYQTFSGLSNINPSDILTIEILKDASATAIYGSRGANGVVLITTKAGKTGEAKFTYEAYYGIQEQVKRIDLMNLREFAQYNTDLASETSGRDPRVEYQDPTILGEGTNWQNALFKVAPMQSHQVSASGGSDKLRYYVSGSYFKQEGTVVGTDFNRFSGRVNLDADLKKWFKLGTKVMFARTWDYLSLNNSSEGIISVALRTSPDVPIHNADGTWAGLLYDGAPSIINPIAKALDEDNILKRNNLNANVYTDITFMKGLTLRTEVGADLGFTNAYHFVPTYQYGSLVNLTNTASRQYNQSIYWQLTNYLTYNKQIEKHNLTAMLGQELSESRWEYLSGSSNGLSSNDIIEPGLGDPKSMAIGSGDGSGSISSFFARGNYSYDNKYFLTYTFRYDGSSNFGPKNRWAPFHSVSGSWKLINEPFLANITNTISDLKIRAGWGQTGNQNIGGYKWGAAISKMPTNLGMGFRQSNIANPYVHWEKQEQINIGLDLGFLKNRIALVLDAYVKTSSAFLMEMQLPSYMGTRGNASIRLNPPFGNFGKIENRGLEISLNTRPLAGIFTWDNDLQVTINTNKLLGLNDIPSATIEGYGQWSDVVTQSRIGGPLYTFYGYKVIGVFQDKTDILNSPRQEGYPVDGNFKRSTVWPGDLKFADISGPDGKPDGVIDGNDRTEIGSPLSKLTYGFNNTFRYKAFELTVFVNGTVGNKLMNYVGKSLSDMNSMWTNQLQTAVDRAKNVPIDPDKVYPFVNSYGITIYNWFDDIDNVKVGDPNATIPRAVSNDPNGNTRISDRYIEDGSYLRVRNVTFTYYMPKNIISKLNLDNMKVYVNLQNMLTITKYTGFDPEVGASQVSNNVFGLDNGRYPTARIYTFGLSVTF
jgi:TonB-dependent starch-binding outer membrane protein SusC